MQTYSIDGFWDTDERFIFRGQKVKVHGLSGLKCAGNNIECGVNTPDNTQGHFVLCWESVWLFICQCEATWLADLVSKLKTQNCKWTGSDLMYDL